MSKIGQATIEINEQAVELGFANAIEATEHGYKIEVVGDTMKLVKVNNLEGASNANQ